MTNMEENDSTTNVHPVSDSHYDTILEDEIHIPIDQVENIPKERHYLGKMDVICPSCSAYHWLDERLTKSTKNKSFFGMCCLQAKIKLPLLTPLPSAIKLLYEGKNSLARSFRKDIRSYNAANVFSSLGVSMDKRILKGRGPTSFTIHGQLSHQIGSLLSESDKSPSYSQLYIYDPHIALDCRQKRNLHLNPAILKIIQETLLESNELCKIYKGAYDVLKSANSNGGESIPIRLAYTPTTDPRRYNLPTSEDIAVIIPGDGTEPTSKRDIILHLKNNNLERISEYHPLYLPSHYVLLFPTGDLGWSTDMKHWDVKNKRYFTVTGKEKKNRLTQLQYFCYRLFERTTEYSALFRAGLLFQQFIVDAWASYEQNRLYWIRTHQADLRCDVYSGLTDIVTNGHNPNDIGKKSILPSTHLGSPRHMYEIYQDSMAITRYYKHPDIFMTVTANPKWPEIQNELKPGQAALDRPDLVARSGKTLSDFPNMPLPCKTWNEVVTNRLITEHQNFVYQGLYEKAQEKVARFNTEQLNAYTEITNSVRNDSGQVFFLSGPTGTGKTFVYNTVADTLRSEGHIVIMVASSGIASLLLTGGRTAHSTFKIPFEVLDDSVCSVTKQTIHAELFKRAKLIIWDEVPMQHRFCVEAVDRTLRDIREINEPFGGVTVVLGGDFKQTLPVITKGTRQEIVCACLTKSHLWSGVRLLTLVKNMRLNNVELPSEIKRCKSTMDLLFKVYPNLNVEEVATETYLQERSILSARNDDVATLNELAINQFPVGCPIMLLRNLQPRDGLCNGMRLMVIQFATRVIEEKILNGSHAGNYVFIPRITLQPSVSETPFQMARRQFPVRLAFAMTINKSQGQSVKYVGIDLRNHVFSHGQLYVALSRCTSSNRISVLLGNEDDDKTTNVVYPEVLL
ncbi:hypothetical protein AQUCO_01100400v1 [Aquilegia coerulea]|uniref:ATP-dependent DNA helicase n=1 Tax=Aquilegia coerulea TaxID=218851 RepID=A0A2G5E6X2_AQUCA|nr:hypothetical protein AQUCO_01100400v1 [Aquilegia coerulea]